MNTAPNLTTPTTPTTPDLQAQAFARRHEKNH